MRKSLPFVIALLTAGLVCPALIGQQSPVATADPTITSEPTYCTPTPQEPTEERTDNKDAVQGHVDVQCDQPQWVEWTYSITDGRRTWDGNVSGWVGAAGCGANTYACGKIFDSKKFKIGGSFKGVDTFTVTGTMKIWTGAGLCPSPQNCYPGGTPLRTIQLDPISAVL